MMKFLSFLLVTITVLLLLVSCDATKPEEPTLTTTAETTAVTTFNNFPKSRTTWNIKAEIDSITDARIRIFIYDMDNLGYVINPSFYNLERFTDGEWVAVTEHVDNESWEPCYVPITPTGYPKTPITVDLNMLYDKSIMIPGKYRAVLYLKDVDFTHCEEVRVEFDWDKTLETD